MFKFELMVKTVEKGVSKTLFVKDLQHSIVVTKLFDTMFLSVI